MAGLRPASVHHTSIPGPGPRPIRPPAGPPRGDLPSPIFTRSRTSSSRTSSSPLSSEGLAKARQHLTTHTQISRAMVAGSLCIRHHHLGGLPQPGSLPTVPNFPFSRGCLLARLSSEGLGKAGHRQHTTPPSRMDEVRAGPHTPTHPPTHTEGDWPASQPASPPCRPPAPAPARRPRLCGGGLTAAPRGGGADACRGAPTCWASGRRGPGSR